MPNKKENVDGFVYPNFRESNNATASVPNVNDEFVKPDFSDKRTLISQAPSQKFMPSFYDYGQQILGQGALMGTGDEIAGTIKGLYNAIGSEGGFLNNAINSASKGIDAERAQMKKVENELGTLKTLALQGAGGLLTGGLGAGRAIAGKGLSLGAKALRGSKQGAMQGAATGAGMSEGTTERILPAVYGAAGGGILGAGLPVVASGLTGTAKGVLRMLPGGVEAQARNVVRGTIPQKVVPRMEKELADMPKGVIADVAPRDAQRLAGEAMRTIGGGRAVDVLAARHKGQAGRLVPKVSEIVSPYRVDDVLKGLSKQRKIAADKDYKNVYNYEVSITNPLKNFFEKDAIQDAYSGAKALANIEGVKLPPLFTTLSDGSKQYAKPTAKMLDYIKQSMDDKVNRTFIAGDKSLGISLQGLRDDFRNHLDEIIPEYKNTRSTYAGFSAAMEAAEDGANFMKSGLGDEMSGLKGLMTKTKIEDLGAHELEAFRSGVGAVLRDKIMGKGFGADVTKIFDSPKMIEKLTSALGKKDAQLFLREIKKESKMAVTWAENQGSQTAQRASAKMSMGKELADAAVSTAAGVPNVGTGINLVRAAANQLAPQPESVAKRVSQLLSSPRMADKQEAFKIMRSGGVTQPISYLTGLSEGATSGAGGLLGGIAAANVGQ